MVSLAEGFGFNTNILETNVLNLAVVVPIVFKLGSETLTAMLDTRREKILGSLRSADDRFKQAQLELDTAKAELASANDKVQEIKNDGRKTLEALTSEQGSRMAEVTTRFAGLKDETIRLEEEKAIAQFRRQLVNVAFEKAISGIQSQMNASLHRKYIDAKISLMTSSL